nr:hypothetical protein [Tanacetum cinerariifolium]
MRQFVKNHSCAVYSTGWSMVRVKSFTDAQLKKEFEKIQKAISNIQIQAFSRTLKRTGPVLKDPSPKRQKSTEALISFVPDVPQSPVVSLPLSSGTRRNVPAVVPTGASTVLAGSSSVLDDVPPSVSPAGVSNKGKSPMVEEDIPIKARTFKQMQEDILGEQAAKRAQVEANASLSKTLLGDDVSEDNFPARIAALIKRKKQALAEKLAKERRNRPMT